MSHSGIFMRPPGKAIVFVLRALFQELPSSSSIATVKEQPASVQWSRLPLHSERQASTNTGALVLKEGGFYIFLGHDHQNEDHLGDLGNGGLCGGGGVGAGRGMWGSPAGALSNTAAEGCVRDSKLCRERPLECHLGAEKAPEKA